MEIRQKAGFVTFLSFYIWIKKLLVNDLVFSSLEDKIQTKWNETLWRESIMFGMKTLQSLKVSLLHLWGNFLSVCLSVQEWVQSTWMRWSASVMRSPSGTALLETSHQRTVNTWRTLLFAATCPTWDWRTWSDQNLSKDFNLICLFFCNYVFCCFSQYSTSIYEYFLEIFRWITLYCFLKCSTGKSCFTRP